MKDDSWRKLSMSSPFFIIILIIALLLGGIATAFLLGGSYGKSGLFAWGACVGMVITALIILLRKDELMATIAIVVDLCIDWFLGIHILGLAIVVILLVVFFLTRSPRYPWVKLRLLRLWALLLLLAIAPAWQGAGDFYDATLYYPNDILGAFLIFWLGTLIARDRAAIRRLFSMLAFFGTLVAVHTIIQELTGKLLFATSGTTETLAKVSNYEWGSTGVNRVGSFFVDPNWNGTFLNMILAITLGLFVNSPSLRGKLFYLCEIGLILPALLFTFSTGAIVGAGAGILAFIIFVDRTYYRLVLLAVIFTGVVVIVQAFPTIITLFLQHSSDPSGLLLRSGAWSTAIRVIEAFPLTGIGLGLQNYALRAEPYRVPAQYIPLVHPHNSYLELAAMAGLPVLLIFVALLLLAFWFVLRNWIIADTNMRSLLGAGIAAAVALSANSVSINGWTLPPLAALGWLVLGSCSSPLLMKSLIHKEMKEDAV